MLTRDDLSKIRTARAEGARWSDMAGEYGYKGGDQLRTAANRLAKSLGEDAAMPRGLKPGTVLEESDEGGQRTLTSKGPRIRTPEELVAAVGLDLTKWTIERSVVNKWEVGVKTPSNGVETEELWQVKLWLKPVPTNAAAELIQELIAKIPALPPREAATANRGTGALLVVCPHDLHLDRLSWAPESGDNWNIDIASSHALAAVDELLQMSDGFAPEQILLVLGNDLLTADASTGGHGAGGTTTKGTPQDVDGRWQRAFRAGTQVCRSMIEACAAIAPVCVMVVPGNHDTTRMFFLGDVLDAFYRDREDVTVENLPTPRKYFQYGETLLGFAHGHQGKLENLPLLMAQEAPLEWCATSHREWLIGHTHAAGLKEIGGVRIRTMPSLTPPDAWHAAHGYNQIRAMEALVFDVAFGFVGMFSSKGGVR